VLAVEGGTFTPRGEEWSYGHAWETSALWYSTTFNIESKYRTKYTNLRNPYEIKIAEIRPRLELFTPVAGLK